MGRELVRSGVFSVPFGGVTWALGSDQSGFRITGCVTLDASLALSGSQCSHP